MKQRNYVNLQSVPDLHCSEQSQTQICSVLQTVLIDEYGTN